MQRDRLYVYKGSMYSSKPRFTMCCKKQVVDEVEYITVVQGSFVPYILMAIMIFAVSIVLYKTPVIKHTAEYNTRFCYDGNDLKLNMRNPVENRCPITVSVYDSDSCIVQEVRLLPGEDIGNVKLEAKPETESGMCTLKYTIDAGWRSVTKEISVLLVPLQLSEEAD